MNKHFESILWDRAHRLVTGLYRLMRRLPDEERHGLGRELCRAAADVAVSIGRSENETTQKGREQELQRAQRATAETESLLLLLVELPLLNRKMVKILAKENQQIQQAIVTLRAEICGRVADQERSA